jgi:rod shape determining protein RodA
VRIDRRQVLSIDWGTCVLALLIVSLSLLLLYSARSYGYPTHSSPIYVKQLVWLGLAFAAMGVATVYDYQKISRWAYVLYGIVVASLVAVLLWGPVINGAQRWLPMGAWHIQPSELTKPILVLTLARYCAHARRQDAGGCTFRRVLMPLALVALPSVLIAKQPDLSTAMILPIMLGVMLIVHGMPRRTWVTLCGLGGLALPLLWYLLEDYQRQRLLTLVKPEADLLGAGYHGWQAKIAIGSGRLWGKGLFAGTQSRLQFLPETHTDFIFAVLGEEMGFVGVFCLLVLFGMLLLHGLVIASQARDRCGMLIATGVVTMLASQIVLNIGMTTGLIPIIGLPLPLMSYGGSSLITTFLCLGLLMNVHRHRFPFSF